MIILIMFISISPSINLLKSFHHQQENISILKGHDESDIKSKKTGKFYLPEIDNKITNKIIELEDSNYENNYEEINSNKITTIKLPNINQHKPMILEALKNSGSNNFGGDYKLMKHNLSNHSLENTINNTHYSKNNVKKKITFKKDQFKELKKNYISPYAQKIISNNLKIT